MSRYHGEKVTPKSHTIYLSLMSLTGVDGEAQAPKYTSLYLTKSREDPLSTRLPNLSGPSISSCHTEHSHTFLDHRPTTTRDPLSPNEAVVACRRQSSCSSQLSGRPECATLVDASKADIDDLYTIGPWNVLV
ncbi:hypothetical protein MMC18_004731 [Xylographa bjoerkii]|nr:hypothetical protein [Xylographa bjoerkii]